MNRLEKIATAIVLAILIFLILCFVDIMLINVSVPSIENEQEQEIEIISVSAAPPEPIQYDVDAMSFLEIYVFIEEYYQLSYELINAIICKESSWNPTAISPTNDLGLMQINSKYWSAYYEKASQLPIRINNDPFDAKSNIIVGAEALHEWQMHSQQKGDTDPYYFLNYYNAGYNPTSTDYQQKVMGFMVK